jgi:hypothetical protein
MRNFKLQTNLPNPMLLLCSVARVAAFPIGIDPERFAQALETQEVQMNIAKLLNRYAGRKVRCRLKVGCTLQAFDYDMLHRGATYRFRCCNNCAWLVAKGPCLLWNLA